MFFILKWYNHLSKKEGVFFMLMLLWLALIILFVVVALRVANHRYTFGTTLFKNSDNNLEKDSHVDVTDYKYYDHKGKMR